LHLNIQFCLLGEFTQLFFQLVVLGVRLAPTSQGSETPSADSKSSSFGSLPKIPTAEPLKVLPINKLIHENRIFVPPLKQMLHDCLSNPPIKKLPPTSQKTRPFFKYGLTENIQDEILPSFDNKTLDIERKSQTQLKMCNPIKQVREASLNLFSELRTSEP